IPVAACAAVGAAGRAVAAASAAGGTVTAAVVALPARRAARAVLGRIAAAAAARAWTLQQRAGGARHEATRCIDDAFDRDVAGGEDDRDARPGNRERRAVGDDHATRADHAAIGAEEREREAFGAHAGARGADHLAGSGLDDAAGG